MVFEVASLLDILSPRLAVRERADEAIQIERVLAMARVLLSVSSLAALYLSPAESFPAPALGFALAVLYSGHAIAFLVLLSRWSELPARFAGTMQAADILWPCLISVFTNGPNSPFLLYFLFALLAAAFRWGMREALLTVVVAIATFAGEAFALSHGWITAAAGTELSSALVMWIVSLIILALLIAYLAEAEKGRRAEAASITQVLSKVRVDAGLKGTLQAVMQELLKLFRGRELLLLVREGGSRRANLWRVERLGNTGELIFTWRQLDDAEAQTYFFELLALGAGAAWTQRRSASTITIDRDGKPLRGAECRLSPDFIAQHPFDRLLISCILVAPDVSCRLFLFGPSGGGKPKEQLRFLRDLTNRVTPAVYNVYLLRRLRSRAAAAERGRVARDLHDGVVQSLHALAFRLYVLRTGRMSETDRTQELLDMQELAQQEASNLRGMIQHLQPFDPKNLLNSLAGMIEQYGYDTGISAKFVCDVSDVTLPPAICREITGVVQEALANVLKHSGAESVLVRLASQADAWILTIEDDGRGFEFSGRFTQLELERVRRGPLIIKQRARAMGGELTLVSKPGCGARLEIKIPQAVQENIV
jgi:signal transduction histidine kinase